MHLVIYFSSFGMVTSPGHKSRISIPFRRGLEREVERVPEEDRRLKKGMIVGKS